MSSHIQFNPLIKKITWQAARLPIIYALLGTLLTMLSYIDDIFPITQWKNIFDLTNKLGNIFIALAILTFFYDIIVFIIHYYENKLLNEHKISALIVASLRKWLKVIFILMVINTIINLMVPTRFYLTSNIINTLMIIAIGWIATQILYTIEAVTYEYMQSFPNKDHIRINALYTKTRVIRNIGTVLILVMTISAILMSFNSVRSIGISLLASAGFLTAIIGFAAQKPLSALFAGLQIVLAQPIKLGDFIVIEKESGIIEEITFTHIIVKLGDQRRLVVPINYLTEKSFENWSRHHDSLRCSLLFYIDYLMPIEPLREELDRILATSTYWDKQAKKLQITDLSKQCVEVRIQISAENAAYLSELRAEVREKLLTFMRLNYAEYLPKMKG